MSDQSPSPNKPRYRLLELPPQHRNRINPSPAGPEDGMLPRPSFGFILICGLILLQLIILMIALSLVWFDGQAATDQNDSVAALDVPAMITHLTTFSDPPPPPTPRPTPVAVTIKANPKSGGIIAAVPIAPTPPPLPAPESIRVRALELTQGIQVLHEPQDSRCQPDPGQPDNIFCNNSIPMVAGRHTMLRVYLACHTTCPGGEVSVQLRLFKDGQEQQTIARSYSAAAVQRVNFLSLEQLRFSLDNSVNFDFIPPPDWMEGNITFQIEALPAGEANLAIASLTKNFVRHKPLRVAYLPIEINGLRPTLSENIDYWLLRMYPVSSVEYYRLPTPDMQWQGDLSKGEVLRRLLYTYWLYGQYRSDAAHPDQLFGWLPPEIYNGGASDPFWCPGCAGPHSSRVAFGGLRPEADVGGPRILAHEIAHNLGAQHAWSPTMEEDGACFRAAGSDISVDPTWPYAQTPYIQEFGIDLYSNPPVIYPPNFYDMMAYCAQPWISPHTYRKIFDSPFLKAEADAPVALSNYQPQVESSSDGTLLVSGVVFPNGNVSNPEVIRLTGAFPGADSFVPQPPAGDDYCLEVWGRQESLLARRCFEAGFFDLESSQLAESSAYFYSLPRVNPADVEKITISKNRVALKIVEPSNNPPQVQIVYPSGGASLSGQQTVQWHASDADGDSLTYDLLYSVDDGQSWQPLAVQLQASSYSFNASQLTAGSRSRLRVIANDGFNTAQATSELFSVEPPAVNSLGLIGPASVTAGQSFDMEIVGYRLAEPGLFGAQFELAFDPALVQAEAVQPNSAFELVIDRTMDNGRGLVSFAASRQGRVANLTGEVTIATVRFIAKADGQLRLDLRNVVAGARGGVPVSVPELYDASVQISR